MKLITLVILLLLSLGEISSTSLAIKRKHKSTALARMEDFQYASLNPFDSGVVLFSQFVTGFLSHFIPFAETLGNAIKEFFNNEKDGKCYWKNLQLSYNKAKKKVKEIDLSKETIKCEQAIIDRQDIQQEIKYKYLERARAIQRLIDNEKNTKNLDKLIEAKKEFLLKVDEASMEEQALGLLDCKKESESKEKTLTKKVINSVKVFGEFYNDSFKTCFKSLLKTKLNTLLKEIGIDIAKKGFGLLVKAFPVLAIGKIGILIFLLGKKIYNLKKAFENKDLDKFAFILGKITGNALDILTGGMLSRRRRF